MSPRITTLTAKKLAGLRQTMSLADNKTLQLWRSFMPRREKIKNTLTTDLISLQIYSPDFFTNFNPTNAFEKWAVVEVADLENTPDGIEAFTLEGGLYAVFDYQGSSGDRSIFEYIFGTWLPGAAYILDDRPHFEVMGENYRNNDPTSEEQIWIPVKKKGHF